MSNQAQQATASQQEGEEVSSFVTDLGRSLTCTICVRPLYEPYTSACGHTHCYSCLCLWFASCGRDKTCADCRAPITAAPAPAYLIRELTHKFTSRVELLPEGETVQQHAEHSAEEAAKVEADKQKTDPQTGGLFRGMFRIAPRLNPIRDIDDGVDRCPNCHWELEDDSCLQCGYVDQDYEDGDDLMEDIYQGHEYNFHSDDSDLEDHLTFLSDMVARRRPIDVDDSEDDDDTDSTMDSFIDDDDENSSEQMQPNRRAANDANGNAPRRGTYTSDEDADNAMAGDWSSGDEEEEEEEEASGSKRGTYTSDEDEEEAEESGNRRGNYTSDEVEEEEEETEPRTGTYTSDEEDEEDEEESGPRRGAYTSGEDSEDQSTSTATVSAPVAHTRRRHRVIDDEDEENDDDDDDDDDEEDDDNDTTTTETNADDERDLPTDSDATDDASSEEDQAPTRPATRGRRARAVAAQTRL